MNNDSVREIETFSQRLFERRCIWPERPRWHNCKSCALQETCDFRIVLGYAMLTVQLGVDGTDLPILIRQHNETHETEYTEADVLKIAEVWVLSRGLKKE